jgi:hypothetical protein
MEGVGWNREFYKTTRRDLRAFLRNPRINQLANLLTDLTPFLFFCSALDKLTNIYCQLLVHPDRQKKKKHPHHVQPKK